MAQNTNKAAQNTMIENLEARQLFSTYGTVNISLTDITPSVNVDYTRKGVDQTWSAGQFYWTRNAANPGTYVNKNVATSMNTFCIEPDQDVVDQIANYTVSDLTSTGRGTTGPLTTTQANNIRELWGRFHTAALADGTHAAAFQMAIWELVCDGDKNLSTGTFSVDSTTSTDVAVKKQAQCWLNSLTGCGPKANLLALVSCTDQDQIFESTTCTPKHSCTGTFDVKKKNWHCFSSGNHSCLTNSGNNGCNSNTSNKSGSHC